MTPPDCPACARVAALADELTRVAQHAHGATAVAYRQNADRIRAALTEPPAPRAGLDWTP
jgi:hypothetical protein